MKNAAAAKKASAAELAAAAKKAAEEQAPKNIASDKPPSKKLIVVDGDFPTTFTGQGLKSCGNDCFVITKDDSTLFDGTADLVSFSSNQITLATTATQTDPAFVYIGPGKNQVKIRYPVTGSASTRHQVLAGSFCSAAGQGLCQQSKGDITGYVFDRPDGISYPLAVSNLTPSRLVVSYSVPKDFIPRSIFLSLTNDKAAIGNFPFTPAPASIKTQLVYQAYELPSLCQAKPSVAPVTKAVGAEKTGAGDETKPSVAPVTMLNVTSPDQPGATFDLLALQDSLLFVSATMDDGVPPNTLVASCINDKSKTALLRRVTRAAADQALLDVQMTPMDQETVRRDFGMRIAGHYLAVTIDVTNRTSKKLQFNKSAMWFDVDFRAVGDPNRNPQSFFLNTANVATANTMVTPNIYHPAFDPYNKKDEAFCRKRANLILATDGGKKSAKENAKTPDSDPFCRQVFYRYGIEQATHISPVNYLAALAAFDYTTEKPIESFALSN